VRKELERALRPQLGGASPRRHRPALTALATTLLTLGVGASEAAAAVTATISGTAPDKLLTITTTAGSPVVVTCGPGGSVRVNDAAVAPATPCAELGRVSVTGDGAPNAIDLTALDDPPFRPSIAVTTSGGAGADSILSGGGADEQVSGGAGNDTMSGSRFDLVESADANVTLTGTSLSSSVLGTDVLSDVRGARLTGGPSANVLDASGWPDDFNLSGVALDGAGGNDTLRAAPTDTAMTGGAGNDTLVHDGAFGTVVVREKVSGTTTLTSGGLTTAPGNDTYSGGTPSFAVLTGEGAGNHNMDAAAFSGYAELIGGGGNDTLRGNGNPAPFGLRDTLTGGLGNDSLLGTPGGPVGIRETANATMTLTDGSLTGAGTDTLAYTAYATLVGGAGNHTIDASAFNGDSDLDGGAGNDTVRGGPGDDTLAAEMGNDSLVAGGGTDRLGGEIGETPLPAGSATLTNTLLTTTGIGTDTISGFEMAQVQGGPGPDTLDASAFTGDSGIASVPEVQLRGGEGSDSLVGSATEDNLAGGGGIDTVRGLAGNDRVFDLGLPRTPNSISGDQGDDTIEAEGFNETIHGGAGIDRLGLYTETGPLTLTDTSTTEEPGTTSTLSGFERAEVFGNGLPNDIDVSGFTGSGGVNMFTAGGDDLLTTSGGPGNDTIDGGDGTDRLAAFGDFDFKLTDTRLESPGGAGIDTVTDIESVSLTGGAGANLLDASATTKHTTTLVGGAGNDTLRGGALADSLNGEGGVDDFFGNAGDDTLFTQDSLAEAMIVCGSGTNMVTADAADTLAADCPPRPTVPGGGGGGDTVAPPPPGGGVLPPIPGVVDPPPDPTAGLRDACFEIPPKMRERVRAVTGGGRAILAISRSNDPTQPLKLTAKARRLRIASATFSVNGKAVPSSGRTGSAPINALKLGARNKVTVTITLTNGKKVTVNQFITVKGCPLPPVKCLRLADGSQLKCSSRVPKRIRAVRLTILGQPGQSARGTARVKRKKRASHGTYSVTLRPAAPLPPGRYVFTQTGTTARKGEKLLAVRVLTLT
jgi:Ca2+-binding RTX toxin-like protein